MRRFTCFHHEVSASSQIVNGSDRVRADDPPKRIMNAAGDEMTHVIQSGDPAPQVRTRFDLRTVDTIGRIKQRSGTSTRLTRTSTGGTSLKATLRPIETIDEWAVLSDGSIDLCAAMTTASTGCVRTRHARPLPGCLAQHVEHLVAVAGGGPPTLWTQASGSEFGAQGRR